MLQRTNNARELCAHDKLNTITQATGTTLESGVLERCCSVACEVVRKRGASTQRGYCSRINATSAREGRTVRAAQKVTFGSCVMARTHDCEVATGRHLFEGTQ